jgi:hypothetical protein
MDNQKNLEKQEDQNPCPGSWYSGRFQNKDLCQKQKCKQLYLNIWIHLVILEMYITIMCQSYRSFGEELNWYSADVYLHNYIWIQMLAKFMN